MYCSSLRSLSRVGEREPNLTVLTLIGQPLRTLAGVDALPYLKELWAVECKLCDARAVEKCVSLEKLYLYSNHIKEVPNLSELRRLRVLWLASNDITDMRGVLAAPALADLNVSKNRVTRLSDAQWASSVALTTLNLSANPLYVLTDVLPLRDAPNLQSLQLADPVYGECPLAQLCNYRSFIVHQIPSVSCLEQLNVSEEERIAVEAFYTEKNLYYNMLRHHIQNIFLKEDIEYTKSWYEKLRVYRGYHVKYKQKNLWGQREGDETENLSMKMEHLKYKITLIEKELATWRRFHRSTLSTRLKQITLEQEHTGNLRFRHFSGACEPMTICQRLLDSYVCPQLEKDAGIRAAELLEVTHVTNKGLEVISNLRMGSRTRRSSGLMLLAPKDGLCDPTRWPFDVVERGFVNSAEYDVHVTNCLCYADASLVAEAVEARRRSTRALPDFAVAADAKHERRVAVVVVFARDTALRATHLAHRPLPLGAAGATHPAHHFLGRGSTSGGAGEAVRPCCKLALANAQLVLCLLVLEFRYVYTDPLEEFRLRMSWRADVHEHCDEAPSRAVGVLDDATMPDAVDAVRKALCNIGIHVASLTTLVLTACGITSIGNLPKMDTVTIVDLSYNKLTSLKGLEALSGVRELNLSFNEVSLSEELPRLKLPALQALNLSWNCVSRILYALPLLRRACPDLCTLDLRYNPIEDVLSARHLRYLAKRCLRRLHELDGDPLPLDSAHPSAPRRDSGAHAVWADVRDWDILRRPVSLRWLVDPWMDATEPNRSEQGQRRLSTNSAFPYWLCYKGLSLVDIKVKEAFKKVKWADFSENLLDDIKRFLVEMPQLEELTLSRNVILEFPVLTQQWTQLYKLDLSGNYLKTIATFQCGSFPSLKQLDVSGNQLSDLNGVQACEDLVECYVACNRITQQAGVMPAKNCRALRVLDLSGNPVERLRDFRPCCVFHNRELEFLCGRAVEDADVLEASDKFGGRLDHEFLLKTPHALQLGSLRSLALVACNIRKVILSSEVLPHLERLDLSNNGLTSLWGLHALPALKTLRLSHNQVSALRPAAASPGTGAGAASPAPPFPSLRVLLLDHNRVGSLRPLSLRELPQLSSLFLQRNELESLDGLQGAAALRFLVLDENKLQHACASDLRGVSALEELWAEGNRLAQLDFAPSLRALRRLFLAGNCISDPAQLRHLAALPELRELTLAGNPVTRRRTFHVAVREYVPWVAKLDGEAVETLVGTESDSNMST